MSIYTVYVNDLVTRLLPPDKRMPNIMALWKALCYPLSWSQNNLFHRYFEGEMPPEWEAGTFPFQTVVSYQHAVYQSLIDDNTDVPTIATSWAKILPDNIGAWERLAYHGSRIALEFAVNKYFGLNYVQPQTPSGEGDTRSDIYIDNLDPSPIAFYVGKTEAHSSNVGQTQSSENVGKLISYIFNYHFLINIPSAFYSTINEQMVRGFIDKYIPSSLFYIIDTY